MTVQLQNDRANSIKLCCLKITFLRKFGKIKKKSNLLPHVTVFRKKVLLVIIYDSSDIHIMNISERLERGSRTYLPRYR